MYATPDVGKIGLEQGLWLTRLERPADLHIHHH
jgi:hypothetical protein